MKLIHRINIILSKFYPKSFRIELKKLLIYSGINMNINDYLGFSTITSLLVSIPLLLIGLIINSLKLSLIGVSSLLIILSILLTIPYFKSTKRAKMVEKVLPDFLNLMAANIKAGATPLMAMMGAAKEDFGILSKEVENSIALSMGSESYEDIFNILTQRINSSILKRIVKILITGIKMGGNLSNLLQGASEEVIQMSVLKNELITSVKSYMMFIALIIIAGLPFLLTVSSYFVETIQGLQSMVNPSEITPAISSSSISVDFLNKLSYGVIIITSFFASILVGSVIDNSPVLGLKYFIPFMLLSILLYLIASNVVPNVIGTIRL